MFDAVKQNHLISDEHLLALVKANLAAIVACLEDATFVELTPDRLIVHR
jgi:hypothetical protein